MWIAGAGSVTSAGASAENSAGSGAQRAPGPARRAAMPPGANSASHSRRCQRSSALTCAPRSTPDQAATISGRDMA